jgi:hypothetical protein
VRRQNRGCLFEQATLPGTQRFINSRKAFDQCGYDMQQESKLPSLAQAVSPFEGLASLRSKQVSGSLSALSCRADR